MKKNTAFALVSAFLMATALFILSCTPSETQNRPLAGAPAYDSVLAQKLGADDMGMRLYIMAFLKRGPNRPQDRDSAIMLQQAHMQNITRLADMGKLIIAGPFTDNGEIRGIYIFNAQSMEEAEALTASDPAIQHGSLIMELHPWYGSAALMLVPDAHKKISKTGSND